MKKNEDLIYDIKGDILPGDLAEDGNQLRPHIVWFEEPVPAINDAAGIVALADIFVVIGTSLVVYPAAGLVHFAPANIPKYILDKKIPFTSGVGNLTAIEKPAAEGIAELMALLRGV